MHDLVPHSRHPATLQSDPAAVLHVAPFAFVGWQWPFSSQ
jgi:hypothetical protein